MLQQDRIIQNARLFVRQCAFFVLLSILTSIGMAAEDSQTQEPNFASAEIKLTAGKGGAPIIFTVRLATTPRERAYGLMFSPPLATKTGMLFLFEDARPRSFWMKNTPIALDILFFDSFGRLVKLIPSATPNSLVLRNSGAAAKYVLEIGGGEAARFNLTVGARLQLPIEKPVN